jgi:hypothetical protein
MLWWLLQDVCIVLRIPATPGAADSTRAGPKATIAAAAVGALMLQATVLTGEAKKLHKRVVVFEILCYC